LAWESPADNVNSGNISAVELGDVLKDWDMRPMLSKYSPAIGVDLAEGDGFKSSGPFKPKAESSNAGKEVKHSEFPIAFHS
jgi:hypothetical protein